jgi:hypothetical protein
VGGDARAAMEDLAWERQGWSCSLMMMMMMMMMMMIRTLFESSPMFGLILSKSE